MKKINLRHPKTTAERKWNECHEKEGIKVRSKRNYIPTAWDDIWVRAQRSWKRYRKTQWK
jgi:hypothetical protein